MQSNEEQNRIIVVDDTEQHTSDTLGSPIHQNTVNNPRPAPDNPDDKNSSTDINPTPAHATNNLASCSTSSSSSSSRRSVNHQNPGMPRYPVNNGNNLSAKQLNEIMHAVRRFHRGDPGNVTVPLQKPDDSYVPALMYPFQDQTAIRHDYPLFLPNPATISPDSEGNTRLAVPLSDLLCELAEKFASGPENAKILKDNFTRIERHVHKQLANTITPVDAVTVITEAGNKTLKELSLNEVNAKQLHDDFENLLKLIPKGGTLLTLTANTPLYLYIHTARFKGIARRNKLSEKVRALRTRLHDLLLVDNAKKPGQQPENSLVNMVGDAGALHIDTQALLKVLGPTRGSALMPEARRQRIENTIEHFEKFLAMQDSALVRIVHHDQLSPDCQTDNAHWISAGDKHVCEAASILFDEMAATFAGLFAAIRIAELELADAYEPDRHDSLLKAFDWEAFSREELLSLPAVVAVESAQHLAGSGMLWLSRLLLSARTVGVIVATQAATNPSTAHDDDPLVGFRFELAYLGVSHREAIVSQSSVSRPDHVINCFLCSLDATRASLHVMDSGLSMQGKVSRLGSWLHGGAALEGRAHPFFHYNPENGNTWAKRFDFTGNPQPDLDWPEYQLLYKNAASQEDTLTIPFTYADFTLIEDQYREHYRVLPAECENAELITVDKYMQLSGPESMTYIPYIWATNADGQLQRLVITRRLAFACRDRLFYWRTLQELAGVRNEYVQEAIQCEREKLEAEFAQQKKQLQAEHEAIVEQVKLDAASQTMQSLAETLLNTNLSSLSLSSSPSAPAHTAIAAPDTDITALKPASDQETSTTQQDPAATQNVTAEAVEDDDDGPEDPWVNSILCTSCNDCMAINAQVFVYNNSKQATIGDPKAGTFEQIVKAAEKCPSRCIHPGKPLNPEEPNLDELIKRAKPFN